MTFLLLLLSFFFQAPKNATTENSAKPPHPSSERIEASYETNALYVFDDENILQLNHQGNSLIEGYESEGENWHFVNTNEGTIIGAQNGSTEFFIQAGANDRTTVTLRDHRYTYEIYDITFQGDTLEFIGINQESYSQYHLVKYAMASGDVIASVAGGGYNDFNGGSFSNNRIRNPLTGNGFRTYLSWTYEGDNETWHRDGRQFGIDIAYEEVSDIAFDEYGELYGIANGTLYHFNLDTTLYVPYSLQFEGNLNGIFSYIETPKSYALAPKSQAIKQEVGQRYNGYVRFKNRFEEALSIQILDMDQDLLKNATLDHEVISPEGSAYLSFEVTSEIAVDFRTHIKFQFESGSSTWTDSVLVEGLIYEPSVISNEDLLFYDHEALHFIDQNDATIPFSREIDIASANESGLIYGISGTDMYRIDPATSNMTLLQNLYSTNGYSVGGIHDIAFDGEDTYYTVSSSSDFRGNSANAIGHYNLNGVRIGGINPDDYVSRIAYSKTRQSLFMAVPEGGHYELHQYYVPEKYTFMAQEIFPVPNHIRDIFFDSQDVLYMISSNNSLTVLSKIDLETGTQQVVDTLATGIRFGLSKLTELPVDPDYEIEVILDSEEVLSNSEELKSSFQVFPNPMTTSFQVKSDQPIERVEMINLSGQSYELKSFQKGTETHWQPLATDPGVYLLQIVFKTGHTEFHKLIVK